LHVVRGATRVEVKLHSGERYSQVQIASYDVDRDIVVLRIPGYELPIVTLGNSNSIKVGQQVFAIGNPLGFEESVSMGIVSAVRVQENGTKVIQTDTAISPGSSGGPLLDANGGVIGVVTFKYAEGENLNFAMPINYARALLSFDQTMSLDQFRSELAKQTLGGSGQEQTTALVTVNGHDIGSRIFERYAYSRIPKATNTLTDFERNALLLELIDLYLLAIEAEAILLDKSPDVISQAELVRAGALAQAAAAEFMKINGENQELLQKHIEELRETAIIDYKN